MLAAATLPSELVLADRYISGSGDPNQIDQQPWNPSVQAMARYPSVLKWMDDNLNWTTTLGRAFLSQQQDVMVCILRLRAQAQALGNLQSTPQQNIVADNGEIEILPANPEIIYVPSYQPEVVYYQRWSFGTPFISFGLGFPLGVWFNSDFDWRNRHLVEWGREHPRPRNWWTGRPDERRVEVRQTTVWQAPRRDIVEATHEREEFDSRLAEKTELARETDSKAVLHLGTDGWTFPIPLIKKDGQWFFDTEAGKEEILNRRIGANELGTIQVCRAYVQAQREYAGVDRNGDGVLDYAQRLRSPPRHPRRPLLVAKNGRRTKPSGSACRPSSRGGLSEGNQNPDGREIALPWLLF